jgi:hypothetical protein
MITSSRTITLMNPDDSLFSENGRIRDDLLERHLPTGCIPNVLTSRQYLRTRRLLLILAAVMILAAAFAWVRNAMTRTADCFYSSRSGYE